MKLPAFPETGRLFSVEKAFFGYLSKKHQK